MQKYRNHLILQLRAEGCDHVPAPLLLTGLDPSRLESRGGAGPQLQPPGASSGSICREITRSKAPLLCSWLETPGGNKSSAMSTIPHVTSHLNIVLELQGRRFSREEQSREGRVAPPKDEGKGLTFTLNPQTAAMEEGVGMPPCLSMHSIPLSCRLSSLCRG